MLIMRRCHISDLMVVQLKCFRRHSIPKKKELRPGKPLIYADPYPFPGPDLEVFGGRSDHSPCASMKAEMMPSKTM